MPEQFDLPGFEAPQPAPRRTRAPHVERPRHGLFIGILPSPADLARLDAAATALRQRHGATRAVVPAGRLHVTCCDLGDFSAAPPQALVDATKAAVAALAWPGFEIVFDRVLRLKGNEALAMRERDGITALTEFRDAMGQVLVRAGVPVDIGSTLHMTLAYGGGGVSEPLAEAVSWRAQDFVLIHSLIGQGQHRHLVRWPLLPGR